MTDSAAIRADLVRTLRRDLIGPFSDPGDADLAEERLAAVPSRWYLTGYLVPADESGLARPEDDDDSLGRLGGTTSPDDEERDISGVTGAGDDEGAEEAPVTRRRPRPTTMGLSVVIPLGCRKVRATVEWGDYRAEPPIAEAVLEGEGTEAERAAADAVEWVRQPRLSAYEIDLADVDPKDGSLTRILPDSTAPQRRGGALELYVRALPARHARPEQPDEDVVSLTVMVVNRRPEAFRRFADVSYAFQVRLTLDCEDGFCASTDLTGYGADDEDLQLHDLHYSDVESYAVGRNTSAAWAKEDGAVRRVWTDPMPEAEVEKVAPNEALDAIGVPFEMAILAELAAASDPAALPDALRAFVSDYDGWIEEERAKLARYDRLPKRRRTAERLIAAQEEARDRIADGVDLLRADPTARLAFRAMNEAVSRALTKRLSLTSPPTWRPFQLAFILLNLRGLTDPTHPDREIVDLLFFPTGGGKTEAYLGLSAYTIALRRLNATGYLGSGVSVIMRYTLRLLTLDQLSRAAGVVCALELMRQSPDWRSDSGMPLLGEWPIEIGLWVGRNASPNSLGGLNNTGDNTAVTRVRKYKHNPQATAPAPIRECPWCTAELGPDSFRMEPNFSAPSRMAIRCLNPTCEFSQSDPLPVLAVDEEIYNRLPAFLIATVDKFAQLPWRGATGAFFGHVDRMAPGDRFYGANHPDEGQPIDGEQCLPPPNLIIQDELHLISGPLGTVAGLYETAIDALCARRINDRTVRPKIVASTATVRRAHDQVQALFDRPRTAIFPAPGIDRTNSYFAVTRSSADENARLYVGLAALGQGPRVVFLKALITLLAAGQAQHDMAERAGNRDTDGHSLADPYLTAVCYFNALRELGGARRIVDDEVRNKLRNYGAARRRLAPADQPFGDRDIAEAIELTSRESTDKVAEAKKRLAHVFGVKGFIDVALATNMISVGLDITRLGLMLVQGQPKSNAEYIQATSRVGRDSTRPGLVLTILNVHKPRDRAHYENFRTYHAQFYRAVEATSVTPWSTRAQDRALAAAVVAMVRHLDPVYTPDGAAGAIRHDPSLGPKLKQLLRQRAAPVVPRPEVLAVLEDNFDILWNDWLDLAQEKELNSSHLFFGEHANGMQALLHRPLDPDLHPETGILDARYRHFEAGWSMRDVEPAVAVEVRTPKNQSLG